MSKLVVLVCFVAVFAAGLTVGLRYREAPAVAATQPSGRSSWLAAELRLTESQKEEMNRIWSEHAGRGRGERDERRRQLIRERDEAFDALIRSQDRPRYEQLRQEYAEKLAALDQEMREAFQNAVDETKGILTAEQREKYESILKNRSRGWGGRDWDRGSRGRDRRGRGHERGRQGDERATSQPVASQLD